VLTRAGHLGTARHAATWTGDNQATWDDLRLAIPMVLSLGLCGQPFSGPDLGGFDGDPDPDLFARWYELGALLPLARGHSHRDACRKEPWAFGPEVEARVRRALELRLRLLPLLYTLFHAASRHGVPVALPMFFGDPADARLRAVDDAFLLGLPALGSHLLVAPIVEPGRDRRRVVLPRGAWYAFEGQDALIEEPELEVRAEPGAPPLFALAGTMVPTAPGLRRAADLPGHPLELSVFLDRAGRALGAVYQDSGEGPAGGADERTTLVFRALPEGGGTCIEVSRVGRRAGPLPLLRARVRRPGGGLVEGPVRFRSTTDALEGWPGWEGPGGRGWGE